MRQVRERTIAAKKELKGTPEQKEIAQWLTIWLQTPEAFEGWITLRQRSKDFQEKFVDA